MMGNQTHLEIVLQMKFFLNLYLFLLPPAEDLRLNSRVFQWPNIIRAELEDREAGVATLRQKAEKFLETRSHGLCQINYVQIFTVNMVCIPFLCY